MLRARVATQRARDGRSGGGGVGHDSGSPVVAPGTDGRGSHPGPSSAVDLSTPATARTAEGRRSGRSSVVASHGLPPSGRVGRGGSRSGSNHKGATRGLSAASPTSAGDGHQHRGTTTTTTTLPALRTQAQRGAGRGQTSSLGPVVAQEQGRSWGDLRTGSSSVGHHSPPSPPPLSNRLSVRAGRPTRAPLRGSLLRPVAAGGGGEGAGKESVGGTEHGMRRLSQANRPLCDGTPSSRGSPTSGSATTTTTTTTTRASSGGAPGEHGEDPISDERAPRESVHSGGGGGTAVANLSTGEEGRESSHGEVVGAGDEVHASDPHAVDEEHNDDDDDGEDGGEHADTSTAAGGSSGADEEDEEESDSEDSDTDDTDDDEEDDDEEEEEEEDEEEDSDGEEPRVSSSHARHRLVSLKRSGRGGATKYGVSANAQKQQLTTKISREGDLNTKVLFLNRKTSFRRFVKEVMLRFGYEQPTDFDMYCIDTSGDRVDIDVDADFRMLTRGFWERLDAATDAAREKQRQLARDHGGRAAGQAARGGESERSRAVDLTPVTAASSLASAAAGSGGSLTDKSSGTTIRLYVRDSRAFLLRQQPQHLQHPHLQQTPTSADMLLLTLNSVGVGVGSPISVRDGAPQGSMTGIAGANGAHSAFLAALGRAGAGGGGGEEDGLLVEVVGSPMGSPPRPTRPGAGSPGNLSLKFAESQRSTASRTFCFEENKEVVWERMSTLGKGSFGTVYEGITSDGKIMAVKVQELPADDDAAETTALATEINLMRSLKHKNIVAYYGCQTRCNEEKGGTKQMEVFLELCHGGSLSQLRRKFDKARKKFSISLVRAYTGQILEGLAFLHSRGVLHRDLKSDNVLISAVGEAKLSDFGCSKRIGGTHTLMYGADAKPSGDGAGGGGGGRNDARYQTLVGSPLFMAPEVMLQDGTDAGYSMAADVWSVGCLVLELLGREPWSFPGANNVFHLMYKISQAKGMPTGVPPKERCPPLLYSFFERCLERDPAKRATAAELLKHEWIVCPDHCLQEVPPDHE